MRLLRSKGLWAILLGSMTVAGGLLGGQEEEAAERTADLVKQLGAGKFAAREAASRELESLGEGALPVLRGAAAESKDPEVRLRAQEAARAIVLRARQSKFTGLQMVLVVPGEFSMGATEVYKQPGESPPHAVRITEPFLLGAHEVTQDEYLLVMGANPSWFAETGPGRAEVAAEDTGRLPVESVTWFDAVAFCNRLSERDGYGPYYTLADVRRQAGSIRDARVAIAGGPGYRLPTEAEWEYACRAGTTSMYSFGNGNTGREANVKSVGGGGGYGGPEPFKSPGRTVRVGSYPPNAWGLYDMHGNVAEWCGDWYGRDYYAASPAVDPRGPDEGLHRVLRGGSWSLSQFQGRSASRFWLPPGEAKEHAGFRVVRAP